MIVELVEPFVYPEEVKDKTAWDGELYHAAYKSEEARYVLQNSRGTKMDEDRRNKIDAAAKEVLKAKGLKKSETRAPMK